MKVLENLLLENEDLVSNAATRLPICICVDASYSMRTGRRMQQANEGIRHFIKEINEDTYAADSVELCIISFGGSEAKVEQKFCLARKVDYRDIVASGTTPLGQAVILALDKIEERKKRYEDHGITTYKPWLILIGDGEATDVYQKAADRLLSLQKKNQIKVLCIGIGEDANNLANFKLGGEVVNLKDFALEDFFSWLSKSMSKQSREQPSLEADIPGMSDLWSLKR